jgi:hypothetical protein
MAREDTDDLLDSAVDDPGAGDSTERFVSHLQDQRRILHRYTELDAAYGALDEWQKTKVPPGSTPLGMRPDRRPKDARGLAPDEPR